MVILIIGKQFIIYANVFAKSRSLSSLLFSPTSYMGHIIIFILLIRCRYGQYIKLREQIDKNEGGLEAFSRGYEIFGFTRR